jgi:prepilin-type N-terminal cleavage/methylation domain-containing protein
MKNNRGFTRIELLVVILILGILSIIAIPIYKEYAKRAFLSEGDALLLSLQAAEKIYYAEFGAFYEIAVPTSYDKKLGIDARHNRIFKTYNVRASNGAVPKTYEIIVYGKYDNKKDITLILKGKEGSDEAEIIRKP